MPCKLCLQIDRIILSNIHCPDLRQLRRRHFFYRLHLVLHIFGRVRDLSCHLRCRGYALRLLVRSRILPRFLCFFVRRFLVTLTYPGVVFCLLILAERLVERFQLQRFDYISSLSEPEEHLVTFLHAFRGKSDPVIQVSQLIRPLLPVVALLKLFENGDPLLQTYVLCLIQAVQKNVSSGILGRDLRELIVICHRLHVLAELDRKLAQRVYDQPSCRMLLVSKQQDILALLISSVDLI